LSCCSYTDKDTEDRTFSHLLPYAYQILFALMNYKRTIQDFRKCGPNGKVDNGFPWLADCVENPAFSGPCKDEQAPVACADGQCKATFVQCIRKHPCSCGF
jgi:hypothetical protein